MRREERPRHRLRDADLEPHGHREEALELAEDELLARLGRDGLHEQVRRGARVEVREEAVYAGFAEAGDLRVEESVSIDGGENVSARAPVGRNRGSRARP